MIPQIHDYFHQDRSYQSGIGLVMLFSPKMALKKQLSAHPPSDYLLGVIHEELRQLADIPRPTLAAILAAPVLEKSMRNASPDCLGPDTPTGSSPNGPAEKKVSRKK